MPSVLETRMRQPLRLVGAAGLFLFATVTVQAQNVPPIKPGLWQVKMDREGGPATPDMSERLKKMSPEQRKQVEAMMKQRGVDMSGGPGNMRICLTKDQLDRNVWQGEQGNCKTDVTSRTATTWKWHSACTQPESVTDGEATFANPENYVVKATTTTTAAGEKRTTKTTLTSKWVGADCGDVKPIQPKKK
jgi:hypothetical protein